MAQVFDLRPDPYDAWTRTHRTNTVLMVVSTVLLGGFGASMYLNWCLYTRPITVAMPSCSGEPARVIVAGSQSRVTEDYVRAFFVRMLRQRYGWNSFTVANDMESYLRLCREGLRDEEEGKLRELVPNPEQPHEHISRLESYLAAKVHHDIVLPQKISQIQCREDARMWHCHTQFNLFEQRLEPPLLKPRSDMLWVRMSFAEVPFTADSLDGLIILDTQELDPASTLQPRPS